MKNSDYLEKYGEKALQLINKKSLKHTVISDINIPSDPDQSQHHQLDRKERKVSKPQKSNSNKSLTRISKSKSKISIVPQNQFTFQKPLNFGSIQEKDKNRKKLIISGLSTPKNNRSARMVSAIHEEKIPGSSTKKKAADQKISQKLSQALIFKQKSIKSVVKQLLQCLDMISEHECKINKWINQLRDIMYHVADQATTFRKKYKEEANKNKKMQKQLEQFELNLKVSNDKKRKPVEVVIMEQNHKLKEKVKKLQRKLQNFQRKQLILIQTIQKLKGPKNTAHQTNESSKKQKEENYASTKIKRQFYGNLEEDEEQSSEQSRENQ